MTKTIFCVSLGIMLKFLEVFDLMLYNLHVYINVCYKIAIYLWKFLILGVYLIISL
jgi:hypothetical protein